MIASESSDGEDRHLPRVHKLEEMPWKIVQILKPRQVNLPGWRSLARKPASETIVPVGWRTLLPRRRARLLLSRVRAGAAAPAMSSALIRRFALENPITKERQMTEKLSAGDIAPAFDLPAASGGRVSLQDLKGSKAVLYFYPKDDTTGCTREAIDFTTLAGEFAKAGTRVFGISPDTIDKHRKFVEKHKLGIDLLSDESKSMLEAYGVWVEKSMYGRKYMGVERTTVLLAADGTIAQIWNKVKVPDHAEAVLAAARAL